MRHYRTFTILAVVAAGLFTARVAVACPFCTVESQTLTEEIAASDAVVFAKLIKPAAPQNTGPDELGEFGVVDPETGKARFRIERILVGEEVLGGVEEIEAVFFGEANTDQQYLIRGVGVDTIDWNIPLPLSQAAVEYIDQLSEIPESGPERMEHFLQYLQHEDPLLAQDTYDEFARAPYADVIGIADKIDRDQLWKWIDSRDVSPSRRALFFTMLGVCGGEEDKQRLEKMMLADGRVLRAAAEATAAAGLGLGGAITLPVVPEMVSMEQRRKQLGFNALVGCYLKLAGADGLDVVDEHFLIDPNADPTKVYGALIALRFLAEETDEVPMDRVLESMRLVLDKPDFAEQAITDLARWEDWSVLDRLVTMFKEAEPKTYVKEPIVAYLDQASRQPGDVGQRADTALEEIEQVDPATVKRARSLLAFGFLGRARASENATDEQVAETEADAVAMQQEMLDESPGPADAAEVTDPMTEVAGAADTAETPEPATTAVDEATPTTDDAATPDDAAPAAVESEPVVVASTTADTAADSDSQNASERQAPNRLLVFGLPIVAAVGFMAVLWAVLRGGV